MIKAIIFAGIYFPTLLSFTQSSDLNACISGFLIKLTAKMGVFPCFWVVFPQIAYARFVKSTIITKNQLAPHQQVLKIFAHHAKGVYQWLKSTSMT
jgi:hypothetical protein